MIRVRNLVIAVCLLTLSAGVAEASWYDDYDAGMKAVRGGNWNVVVQKMSAAIAAKPRENNKERAYGTIFYNYHPYYYRGVAYLNTGKYQQAISDLEAASGPGEVDLGPIETLLRQAKSRLEDSAPAPVPAPTPVPQPITPVPQPVVPPPVPVPVPVTPAIDSGLRRNAEAAINTAKSKMAAAQQRRAGTTQQFSQGVAQLADANSRFATARSNDDLNAAIAAAGNAGIFFDAAPAPGITAPPVTATVATTTSPRPTAAANIVLDEYKDVLRRAMKNYFDGEFEAATKDFKTLSQQLPNNGWIWAFLGASQYSVYAFEADESYRAAAMDSFKKAKSLRSWKSGLPERYFSKRIRRVFSSAG